VSSLDRPLSVSRAGSESSAPRRSLALRRGRSNAPRTDAMARSMPARMDGMRTAGSVSDGEGRTAFGAEGVVDVELSPGRETCVPQPVQ